MNGKNTLLGRVRCWELKEYPLASFTDNIIYVLLKLSLTDSNMPILRQLQRPAGYVNVSYIKSNNLLTVK